MTPKRQNNVLKAIAVILICAVMFVGIIAVVGGLITLIIGDHNVLW